MRTVGRDKNVRIPEFNETDVNSWIDLESFVDTLLKLKSMRAVVLSSDLFKEWMNDERVIKMWEPVATAQDIAEGFMGKMLGAKIFSYFHQQEQKLKGLTYVVIEDKD